MVQRRALAFRDGNHHPNFLDSGIHQSTTTSRRFLPCLGVGNCHDDRPDHQDTPIDHVVLGNLHKPQQLGIDHVVPRNCQDRQDPPQLRRGHDRQDPPQLRRGPSASSLKLQHGLAVGNATAWKETPCESWLAIGRHCERTFARNARNRGALRNAPICTR